MLYDKFRLVPTDTFVWLKLLQNIAYNTLKWTETSGQPGHRTTGDKQLRYQHQQGAERERLVWREREREREKPGQTAGRSDRGKRWSDD